jgi:hypothetical protein
MFLRWAMKNKQQVVSCAMCTLGLEARVKVKGKVCTISH